MKYCPHNEHETREDEARCLSRIVTRLTADLAWVREGFAEAKDELEIREYNFQVVGQSLSSKLEKAEAALETERKECLEQARLNGMGGEREAALLARLDDERNKVKELEAAFEQQRKGAENYRDRLFEAEAALDDKQAQLDSFVNGKLWHTGEGCKARDGELVSSRQREAALREWGRGLRKVIDCCKAVDAHINCDRCDKYDLPEPGQAQTEPKP